MEDTGQQVAERYALVSSLYGPGTIACWYLTILSVLVSWTLHPRKRKSGSIDVDLLATLTLPTVAAGHLISQISTLTPGHDNSPGSGVEANQFAQSIAAIEAPFSVVESFMAISVILFLVSVWMVCLRRAISVAMVGLLCLATECYIHFSSFRELGIRYNPLGAPSDEKPAFTRSFVADFTGLVIAIPVILAVCSATLSAIITYMLRSGSVPQEIEQGARRRPNENPAASQRAVEMLRPSTEAAQRNTPPAVSGLTQSGDRVGMEEWKRDAKRTERVARTSAWISLVFVPATALLSILPSAMNALQFSYAVLAASSGRTITVWARLKIFAGHFYPHSSNSFLDLDQAVATAAGATVLGFSIYSVANARYKMQSSRQSIRVEEDSIQLDRLVQEPTIRGLEIVMDNCRRRAQ
ncbi:hypothetical protein A1O7_04882 [Cladophialophora yegresii CBS 114405]|uniref:Uncharacterized protein n=1 Tax=Cladophialophora yegresii CBS 114405 TaxID=1182544 RepID=W9WQS6_9EURO|nr:uncharacterized protein A1O7_04882 [Cladophialophora yegresii CBS 114405]EXJ60729.1 hypothetical protein A1O7_04882 [Cladophialophora yegresii CBS 114405]